MKGAVTEAWDYVENHQHLSNLEIYQELLTPAMKHIGLKWENFEITVAEEHLASGVCDLILTRLGFKHKKSIQELNAPRAMFFCVDSEQHYLGLKMVSSLFEEKGWNVHFLGANLPVQYALQAAKDWKPDVIGMSVSIATHLPKLREYTDAFACLPKKPAVLIGGRLAEIFDINAFSTEEPMIVSNLYDTNNWIKGYQADGTKNAFN
ncbi:methanogenic corrinoid protein MtbC1 [Cytobacillus purgationiresistens]|uniref:Methanogenic corrinoid protein MtbC1 n=1 Tax=Cytobacillus purgationiresistens TaxID=863449 RepID=A0ABU0AQZ4_9BACI|nr:cobalamin B12-binding domain-containing protein [Cytobacillus purgationiresistens]MDQ0273171.1 methanogenic corrinoid protein MtbC1 [Cytobacillus purgationiresistens]